MHAVSGFRHLINNLGVGQMTQIIEAAGQGISLVGPLPAEVQSSISFSAAILSATRSPDASRAFVAALLTPKATAILVAAGAQ